MFNYCKYYRVIALILCVHQDIMTVRKRSVIKAKTLDMKGCIIMGTARTTSILLALLLIMASCPTYSLADGPEAKQEIFPGQAEPILSELIMKAFNLALKRDYDGAKAACLELGEALPQDPSGPTGEMVLYQVMMLENEDYELDAEFRDAAGRAEERSKVFVKKAEKNDWYYTLLGASWGIQGIYYLRQDEYFSGLYYGFRGLSYMRTAAEMSPDNWEAKMGIGVFLYYRSALASIFPAPWLDQRERGIEMVRRAGEEREYLDEVSRIALSYIYYNEKDYDKTASYMDDLISERPYFPIFYHLAGRAMMAKGDYQRAYDYYDAMRKTDPGLYLPYLRLADISEKMGNNGAAREWLDLFYQTLGKRKSSHLEEAADLKKKLAE